jgi:hypothetical protein
MRRWGFVISLFYTAIVIGLLWPGLQVIAGRSWGEAYEGAFGGEDLGVLTLVVWAILLFGGQFLLLFVTVDVSWRRLRPRQHVAAAAATIGFAVALLVCAAAWSLLAGIYGDDQPDLVEPTLTTTGVFISLMTLWVFWAVVFHRYYRAVPARTERVLSWLLRGSILELLIAVPSHVIVRRRDDCSAPVATSFGIATGIAVMLMCFGPGVLSLYRRRLDRYQRSRPGAPVQEG